MQQAGFLRNDPVFPDLAFSLDKSRFTEGPRQLDAWRQIRVSPMVYCDPRFWPIKNEATYPRYLMNMRDVFERFIGHNY